MKEESQTGKAADHSDDNSCHAEYSDSDISFFRAGARRLCGNTTLLAERFGADSARITRVILLSTDLAFPSFSAWVTYVKT